MAAVASQYATPPHNLSKSARAEAAGEPNVLARESFSIPRGDVAATLNFFVPPEDGSVPFNYVETPPEDQPQRNYKDFSTSVTIHDIRGHEDEYNLDKDAFALIQNVPDSAEKEFTSEDSIQKNYYPEVEKLILETVPGSNRVVFFDHTIRPLIKGDRNRGPVLKTHIDQTADAAKERVKRHLGEEAEKL